MEHLKHCSEKEKPQTYLRLSLGTGAWENYMLISFEYNTLHRTVWCYYLL